MELQAWKVEGGKELPITYTAARADTELSRTSGITSDALKSGQRDEARRRQRRGRGLREQRPIRRRGWWERGEEPPARTLLAAGG